MVGLTTHRAGCHASRRLVRWLALCLPYLLRDYMPCVGGARDVATNDSLYLFDV